MRLLVDINVVLDLVQQRNGFSTSAAQLFSTIETKQASAYVAGHTVTTAFYIIRRTEGSVAAAAIVADLLRVLEVVPVDRHDLLQALALEWRDFEDAVQAVCAEKAGADFIVTRDLRGFTGSRVPAVDPSGALARLAA